MRIQCWLFGCRSFQVGYDVCDVECVVCRADPFDEYHGSLGQRIWWLTPQWLLSARRWVRHRCGECQEPIWFSREFCCSQKCSDSYIPF